MLALDWSAALKHPYQGHDDGQYEQEVDEATGHVQ
jgi:hypothetical protein